MSALPSSYAHPPDSASQPWRTAVWHASELAQQASTPLPTGHAALDAELPGGGWPLGQLIDCLQAPHTQQEWRLFLPALCRSQLKGHLVLIGSPLLPHLPALAHQGIAANRMLLVHAQTAEERLWAAEQALRCHELGALLVWLPQARPAALRRLQLACLHIEAHTTSSPHTPPLPLIVALRPLTAQPEACAAPLRLAVHSLGRGGLAVNVFKRRGPPMEQAVRIGAELPAWACLPPRATKAAPAHHVIPWNAHAVDRLRHRQHHSAPAVTIGA